MPLLLSWKPDLEGVWRVRGGVQGLDFEIKISETVQVLVMAKVRHAHVLAVLAFSAIRTVVVTCLLCYLYAIHTYCLSVRTATLRSRQNLNNYFTYPMKNSKLKEMRGHQSQTSHAVMVVAEGCRARCSYSTVFRKLL